MSKEFTVDLDDMGLGDLPVKPFMVPCPECRSKVFGVDENDGKRHCADCGHRWQD
jgi:DNA-directed RNA polymerase subunit RPC12/RpoP